LDEREEGFNQRDLGLHFARGCDGVDIPRPRGERDFPRAGSTCRVTDLGRPARFVEEAIGHVAVTGTGGVVEGTVRVVAGEE
jgi:hypothetical protein